MDIRKLKENPNNPQTYTDIEIENLVKSITDFSKMLKYRPIVYDPETNYILGGNKRYRALMKAGYTEVQDEWVRSADELTEQEKHDFIVLDNLNHGEWDYEKLKEWDTDQLEEWGMDLSDWEEPEEITGEFDNSQNPNDYASYFFTLILGDFKATVNDKELCEQLSQKINEIKDSISDSQAGIEKANTIARNIAKKFIDNADSFIQLREK